MSSKKNSVFLKVGDSFKNKLEQMYNRTSVDTKKIEPTRKLKIPIFPRKPLNKSSPEILNNKIESITQVPITQVPITQIPITQIPITQIPTIQNTQIELSGSTSNVIELLVTQVLDIQKQELNFKNDILNRHFNYLVEKNQELEKNINLLQKKQIEQLKEQLEQSDTKIDIKFSKNELIIWLLCLMPLLFKIVL